MQKKVVEKNKTISRNKKLEYSNTEILLYQEIQYKKQKITKKCKN